MKAKVIGFGEIDLAGERYSRDVVIDGGRIRRRDKGPSKSRRDQYGHTPLTAAEDLPWGGRTLIVGTGVDGALPIADDVLAEAKRRHVAIETLPTPEACRRLADLKRAEVFAVLHVTC